MKGAAMVVLAAAMGAADSGGGAGAAPPSPSPSTPSLAELSAYHVVVLELGPSWDRDRSVSQQTGMREHGQYMSELSAAGRIVLGGPMVEDGRATHATGAMVIIASADAAEARRLMEADPGLKAGLFRIADVRRFVVGTGAWRPWRRPAR